MTKKFFIKWQEELKLYNNSKNGFILEGNVLDNQVYLDSDDFELVTLNQYLYQKFTNKGYKTISFFNHVDGFYNQFDKDAIGRLKKIIKNSEAEEAIDISLNREDRNSKFGDATEKLRKIMSSQKESTVTILDLASRYISSPDHLEQDEQYFYTELFLAIQNGKNAPNNNGKGMLNNLIIIIVDKLNDVPAWFYLNNPSVKPLYINKPNTDVRELFFDNYHDLFLNSNFYTNDLNEIEASKFRRKFVDLTDGFINIELIQLMTLMNEEKIDLINISDGITLFKHGIRDNPWNNPDLLTRLKHLEEDLKKDIKGQEHALSQVTDIIKRSVYGLSGMQHSKENTKPKGVLFFTGPTGTGKTELAKSLSRWLFSNEDSYIRFDMSEYSQSHADQKLLGAPPGYVGYEMGGQLTNAVKEKPFSILLFDEIEKAHPSILDKFLQILEDGRMTDGRGETIYFSDTIIIFTSNLGVSKRDNLTGQFIKVTNYTDDNTNYDEFRSKILGTVNDFFVNDISRPEIKNRIGDNFIVFEYINEETALLIAEKQLNQIVENLSNRKQINLILSEEFKDALMKQIYANLEDGGRGVGNAIEKHFINPLSRFMADEQLNGNLSIVVNELITSNNQSKIVCTVNSNA